MAQRMSKCLCCVRVGFSPSLPSPLSFILWLFPLALCHSYILWLSHQAEPLTNMPIATTEKKLMMLKTTKRLFSDRK